MGDKLSDQVKEHSNKEPEKKKEYKGNTENMISTGSTLLDLAISGGRVKGGGIPSGIFVEIFGPSGCGKTVLLCEIAGDVQRKGGEVMFRDAEARLDKTFANIFDLDTDEMEYDTPDKVEEIFSPIKNWEPEPEDETHGIFIDSLAAFTTDRELDGKDKYGAQRAKEFSSGFRVACRIIQNNNYVMVASNQVRDNMDGGPWSPQYTSPGGNAIDHHSSLKLKCSHPSKIKEKHTVGRRKEKRPIGVSTHVTVQNSSVWKPFREADVSILFDYGIDDIRENLQFVKDVRKESVYKVRDNKLHKSLNKSVLKVEEEGLEDELREETIELWEEVENKFSQERKAKER